MLHSVCGCCILTSEGPRQRQGAKAPRLRASIRWVAGLQFPPRNAMSTGHEVYGMNDPRPDAPRAGRFCPVGDRAHTRPSGQVGGAPAGLSFAPRRDPHPQRLAGGCGGARCEDAPLSLQQRLQKVHPLHAAILRSPREGAPFLAHPRRFTFVDIGANVGAYSLFVAARAGGTARILAVEPQPDIFDRLAYNISLNPFGTIKAVDCAVADKTGELTLFLDPATRRIECQACRIEPGRLRPGARRDAPRSPQPGGFLEVERSSSMWKAPRT